MTRHIGGTSAPELTANDRWRIWQARGDENDRRREARMRALIVIAAALGVVALAVALVS
jgi:hypothetical protein